MRSSLLYRPVCTITGRCLFKNLVTLSIIGCRYCRIFSSIGAALLASHTPTLVASCAGNQTNPAHNNRLDTSTANQPAVCPAVSTKNKDANITISAQSKALRLVPYDAARCNATATPSPARARLFNSFIGTAPYVLCRLMVNSVRLASTIMPKKVMLKV